MVSFGKDPEQSKTWQQIAFVEELLNPDYTWCTEKERRLELSSLIAGLMNN